MTQEIKSVAESTVYKIEGRIDGIWEEDYVIVSGDPVDVNRYRSEADAEAALDGLVDVFERQCESREQCRADLRVTTADNDVVSRIVCNDCGNTLPSHTVADHLDPDHVVHQCPWHGSVKFTPDPEHDIIGNAEWSHYEVAEQLEMRGYVVSADTDDNEHSWVRHPATGDKILADIYGDSVATVKNC